MCLRFATALAILFAASAAHADAPGEEAEHAAKSTAPAKKSSNPRYKKKNRRHAILEGRLASPTELRDEPLDKPSGHIELYAVNFREELDVDLYKEDGSFDEDALDKLNHLLRCKRTDTEKAIDPRLYEMLSRVYDRFQRRIELVSGFRNQKRTSSFHFHGSASDIRIPGVPDKELHKFVQTLDTGGMGIGIYPRAGFIHVDIRPEPSYRWTDWSPPGTQDMGHKHKSPGKKKTRAPNA